jgi:hypothetical protein
MEVIRVLGISVGMSLVVAAFGWFAVSIGLGPLERLRQQLATRAKAHVEVERARA